MDVEGYLRPGRQRKLRDREGGGAQLPVDAGLRKGTGTPRAVAYAIAKDRVLNAMQLKGRLRQPVAKKLWLPST